MRIASRALSDAGLAVASGLAVGIDVAAHHGALMGNAGTIAVIGMEPDIVYPSSNHDLAHEIARDGVIVSEWPLRTPPRSANFPQRNRLIAGLSGSVLIVEAAMRSGSLITARLANEMRRDVFADARFDPCAVVARLSSPHQTGREARRNARRRARGIRLRTSSRAEETRRAEARQRVVGSASLFAAPDTDADSVLTALGHAPATLEVLAARTDMGGAALQGALLQLELAGRIAAMPGGRYTAVERS